MLSVEPETEEGLGSPEWPAALILPEYPERGRRLAWERALLFDRRNTKEKLCLTPQTHRPKAQSSAYYYYYYSFSRNESSSLSISEWLKLDT